MNFSPKHRDNTVRALYFGLFLLGFITMVLKKDGTMGVVFTCISLVALVTALFLLVRYELTTYSYIMNAKEDDFEFFVDKAVGKRGNYVCYYMISDVVFYEKYNNEKKEALKKDFPNIFFYNYTHNLFSDKKQVIIFKNSSHYDAVIIDVDEAYDTYIKNAIELVKQAKSKPSEDDIENNEAVNITEE